MRIEDDDRPALSRLDASEYGDPGDGRPVDVAPPCARCGGRERQEGSKLCEECDDAGQCPECGAPTWIGWENGTRVCANGHRWTDGGEQ